MNLFSSQNFAAFYRKFKTKNFRKTKKKRKKKKKGYLGLSKGNEEADLDVEVVEVVDSVGVADKEKSFSQFWEDWVVFLEKKKKKKKKKKRARENALQLRFFYNFGECFFFFFASQTLQTFIHSLVLFGFCCCCDFIRPFLFFFCFVVVAVWNFRIWLKIGSSLIF